MRNSACTVSKSDRRLFPVLWQHALPGRGQVLKAFLHLVQCLESMCELQSPPIYPRQEYDHKITNVSSEELSWNGCCRIQWASSPDLAQAVVSMLSRCLFATGVALCWPCAGPALACLLRRMQPAWTSPLSPMLPSLLMAFITIWKENISLICVCTSHYTVKKALIWLVTKINSFFSLNLCKGKTFFF